MEFRLFYKGPLKSNGNIKDKQNIRRFFHSQLQKLWNYPPLNVGMEEVKKDITIEVGYFNFRPVICKHLALIAQIDILLLKNEEPGEIITHSGDIDNRLKTLLDALRMPKSTSEIPKRDTPFDNENPFCCLLEDDALISSLSIISDRLLFHESQSPNEVILVIHVKTTVTKLMYRNMGLGG